MQTLIPPLLGPVECTLRREYWTLDKTVVNDGLQILKKCRNTLHSLVVI